MVLHDARLLARLRALNETWNSQCIVLDRRESLFEILKMQYQNNNEKQKRSGIILAKSWFAII